MVRIYYIINIMEPNNTTQQVKTYSNETEKTLNILERSMRDSGYKTLNISNPVTIPGMRAVASEVFDIKIEPNRNRPPIIKEFEKIFQNNPHILSNALQLQYGKLLQKKTHRTNKGGNCLLGRLCTLVYEAVKIFTMYVLSQNQPTFTKEDQEMKEKIWGYTYGYSAFSNKKSKGTGDHMYGIREGLNHRGTYGGGFGMNDHWNIIPCTTSENSGEQSWKKVTIDGIKKNIVYDSFTDEEKIKMQEQDPIKWKNYNCWIEWNKYAKSRGARCYVVNMKPYDTEMRNICKKHLEAMYKELLLFYNKIIEERKDNDN